MHDFRGGTNLRMAELLLGPVLRYVGERDATIWVETTASCEVEVRAGSVAAAARTFGVAGHHYAVVALITMRARLSRWSGLVA